MQEAELKQIISVRDDQKSQLHQQIDGLISSIQEKEDKINTLEQQLEQTGIDEDTIQSNEGRQASISDQAKADFLACINLLGNDELVSAYVSHYAKSFIKAKQDLDYRVENDKELIFFMNDERSKGYLKLLKYIELPCIQWVEISGISSADDEDIIQFMINSFSRKLPQFMFNHVP